MSLESLAQKEAVVQIKIFSHYEGIELPKYETEGASGLDLRAAIQGDVTLAPGKRALIPTGIAISLPKGLEAQVRPRSGLAIKYGIGLLNAPGTIDSDYRGEIQVILINHGDSNFVISRGQRIAQMVVAQCMPVELRVAMELDVTKRNSGGFGHTGF